MTRSAISTAPGIPFRVVFLLGVAVFINYVDRGNLATAGPLLKDELGLSNSQVGILLSAFFWSYAPLQPVAGWLAHRFEVRYVLACGLAVWSTATMLTGLANSFATLLLLRVLLGIGESATYPCNSRLLAQRAPEHERGRANGLIAAGQALGPTFGTLGGGLLMVIFGWRAVFVAFGVVSLVWLLPWFAVTRRGPAGTGTPIAMRPLPYLVILKERALWGGKPRPILLHVRLLSRPGLAAAFPRQDARLQRQRDGPDWRRRLCRPRRKFGPDGLDVRSMDYRWRFSESRTQDVADLRADRCCDPDAAVRRCRSNAVHCVIRRHRSALWTADAQYLRHIANPGRRARGGSVDGCTEFPRQSVGRHRATSDRFHRRSNG